MTRPLLADWDINEPVPPMPGAKCAGVHGFTEKTVSEQLAFCWSGDHCPVLNMCRELGLRVMPAKDENHVFGGMTPDARRAEFRARKRRKRAQR